MTMSSLDHALAYARICDLTRTAAAGRRTSQPTARRTSRRRTLGATALRWLRLGQLGGVGVCTDS